MSTTPTPNSKVLRTELILRLIPLAIQAFGAISAEVMQLRAAAGMTDEQLLDHAQATDQETMDLIQAHIAALQAADALPAAGDTAPPQAPVPENTGGTSTESQPAAPAAAPVMTSTGVLVHGQ